MKFLTTSSIILLFTFSSLFSGIDVEEVKEKLALIQNTGNSGNDFWFTLPPAYEDESAGYDNFVEILVTSPFETNVTVEVPGKGYNKVKQTIINGVVVFQLNATQAQPILHSGRSDKVRPARNYKGAGIHVKADAPVIVYVIIKYHWTSDGFFAIPTKYFGNKYINAVYNEPALWSSGWFNPFTGVVAAYDSTNITFTMGGGTEGIDEAPISGANNLKTGESHSFSMDKGDVWLVSINGQKQDLSGSLFEGNKPFAIVSGMNCANFPVGNPWCDYTVNMEFPVKNWGKTHYVQPQMNRKYNGIIRVFASEPKTEVYRGGSYIGTIEKGGGGSIDEAYIELRVWPKLDDNEEPIPPKIATISANKPIAVVYYNTGTSEDKPLDVNSDPFMNQIPPIESAISNSLIFSPNATGGSDPYNSNYIKITFPIVDKRIPDDLVFAELSTSGIIGKYRKLSELFGEGFDEYHVPFEGKKYGVKTITIGTNGVYSIKSDSSKFVTESIGFSNYESYGMPSTFDLRKQNSGDSSAPLISYVQQCNGDIYMEDGIANDKPDEESLRSNMAEIYMIAGENYTFKSDTLNSKFVRGEVSSINWQLTVIDKSKPASALLYAVDMVGNDTIVFIEYVNTELEATSSSHSLQNPKLKEISFQDTIRNLSNSKPIYVSRVEFGDKNSGFSVVSFEPNNWDISMPILPNSEIYVNVNFSKENIDNTDIYSDSLFIGLGVNNEGSIEECQYYPIANQRVTADFPNYEFVSYSNFGELEAESKPIKLQDTIRNLSDRASLYVSRLDFKYGDKGYTLGGFTPFDWDLSKPIAHNAEVLVDIIFNPKSVEQGVEDIELTDSLGIGISVMNANNELEELEFSYKTEQKAILKAKDLSSVTPEQTLSEYMTVTESNIQILPQALADGFTELSIFSLDGSKVISASIHNQNSIAFTSLKSGTYLITLRSENRLLTRKINIVK